VLNDAKFIFPCLSLFFVSLRKVGVSVGSDIKRWLAVSGSGRMEMEIDGDDGRKMDDVHKQEQARVKEEHAP
jgi:hypothetical protein